MQGDAKALELMTTAQSSARQRLLNNPTPAASKTNVDARSPLGKMLAVHSRGAIRAPRGANPLEALDKARR